MRKKKTKEMSNYTTAHGKVTNNKKATIMIEELDDGNLRITVTGPPYIYQGNNLSSCDIALGDHDGVSYLGRVTLYALYYGITHDLRFCTRADYLPGGERRCDSCYKDVDPDYHFVVDARCTRPAAVRVRVTDAETPQEALLCAKCYEMEDDPDPWGPRVEFVAELSKEAITGSDENRRR